MKKGVLMLIFILTCINIVYAQYPVPEIEEIPDVVTNRLPIEFHSVTGTESITLDLEKYFGRKVDVIVSKTENVNVVIDSNAGTATLSSKDPNWRGIEQVVFATSVEYLEVEEEKKSPTRRRYGNLTKINLSIDKIARPSDAFTQEQFNTIIGTLNSQPIDIVSFVSNSSLVLAINKELTINFDTAKKTTPLPEINFDFKTPEEKLSLAYYEEKSDILYFSFVLFGIAFFIVLGIYAKYSWAGPFKEIFLKPKEKTEVSKSDAYKKDLKINLKKIRQLIGQEKPSKLYKKALSFTTQFLLKGHGIKASNYSIRMDKLKIDKGTQSKIRIFFTEYKTKVYTSSQIKDSDVNSVISYIESLIRGL